MEKSHIVDCNLKYDMLYFVRAKEGSTEVLRRVLEKFLIFEEDKIKIIEQEFPGPKEIFDSVEQECQAIEVKLREEILKDSITEDSIILIEREGIFKSKTLDGEEYYEKSTGVVATQGSRFRIFSKGNGNLVGEDLLQQAREATDDDYEYKANGFSHQISIQALGVEDNDFITSSTEVALTLSIGKIWLNWQIEVYHDFPLPGNYFEDWLHLLCQGEKFHIANDLYQLQIENSLHNKKAEFDVICSIGARGFIWGGSLAYSMRKGLCLLRKKGKLPGDKIGQEYRVWGKDEELEICQGLLAKGSRVLLIDDYVETGGTNRAGVDLLTKAGVKIVAVCTFRMRADRWDEAVAKMGHDIPIYLI